MKKLLSTILALCLVISFIPTAFAESASGTCGDNLTWKLENEVLTISGTGKMDDYSANDKAPWLLIPKLIVSVEIEDGVTSIGDYAFFECDYLASVKIPDSVISIGNFSFFKCSSLTRVTIPDAVFYIGNDAFAQCDSITSIKIPSNVVTIGSAAFYCCNRLSEIAVSSDNTSYSSVDGVLFNFEQTELITYPSGKTGESYAIAQGVVNIQDGSFCDNKIVKYIKIPDSVERIGAGAFSNCSNLESADIPNSVIEMGNGLFSGCTALKDITIPTNWSSIIRATFQVCTAITNIAIPDNITNIGKWAFSECSALTAVTISDSVTRIEEGAFLECNALTDVYYSGSEDEWNAIDIDTDNDPLTSAAIHYNSAASVGEPANATGFGDVAASDYYYAPVLWAIENGVTTGTTTTMFSPSDTCTRAQIITFLWRAVGSPSASGESVFSDVDDDAYYTNAVQWASENEIDLSTGTFKPNAPCTRAMVAEYLYRLAGSPNVSTASSFIDVSSSDSYAYAVAWAVENGITTGTSSTTFSPDTTCTRGQIVTFLYRYMA